MQKQIKKPNKIKEWFQRRSPYGKNKTINALTFFVFVLTILLFNYSFIFGAPLPKFFVLDFFLILIAIAPIFFFRGTLFDMIWMPIIMLFVTFLLTLNVNYYKFMGTIFSIKDIPLALQNMVQAGTRIKDLNWVNISLNIVFFVLFLSWLLTFNIVLKFKENSISKNPRRLKFTIFAGTFLVCSVAAYEFNLAVWTQSEKNDYVDSVDFVTYNCNYHFETMGMLSYYNKELRQLVNKQISNEKISTYLSNPEKVDDKYTGVLDIKTKTPNIFTILYEAGDYCMVDPYITPNLWKFRSQGLFSDHNYSNNHTNVTNILSVAGTHTSGILDTFKNYTLPFALPQILKKNNYNTRFYHDTTASTDCYADKRFMPQFGFDNFIYHDEILGPDVPAWKWEDNFYNPDTIVAEGIKKNLNEFHAANPNTPFYSQWMSMFTHMDSKTTDANREKMEALYETYGPKLEALEKEGKWSNPFTDDDKKDRYLNFTMKTMNFDDALGILMDYFYGSSDPYLNNTMIIIFGDHNWYEGSGQYNMSQYTKNIFDRHNIHLYSTVLAMYHPDETFNNMIKNETSGLINDHIIQKMTTPACITPTVLDLLGIQYNKKIYQDQSIFDIPKDELFDEDNHEIFYSAWTKEYMNEHYSSVNGASISNIIDDNDTQFSFLYKVREKQTQLKIIDAIFANNFFGSHNYEDYLPKD